MKLRQNAREVVLAEIEGLGLVMGEIRYNRQTETINFALEKSAFFDLYFPCAVVYDQQRGPVVHPHLLAALTTSSVRVQRSRMSCFVLEQDITPDVLKQYHDIINMFSGSQEPMQRPSGKKNERPDPPGSGGSRIIPLNRKRDRQD